MSYANPNGRWEFDEQGNTRYVPPDGSASRNRNNSYTPQNRKQNPSAGDRPFWIGVVACFIFGLWPVAIVLIVLKMTGILGNKNYSDVKNRVDQTVSRAAQKVAETANNVADSTSRAFNGTESRENTGANARNVHNSPYAARPNYRMPEGFTTHERKHQQEAAAKAGINSTKRTETERQRQKREARERGLGNVGVLQGIGIGIAGLFGFCTVMEFLDILERIGSGTGNIFSDLAGLLTLMSFAAVGGVLIGIAGSRKRKIKRYVTYLAMIGDRDRVSIAALAKTTGRAEKKVSRDLEDMITRGYFDSGYIDYSRGELVLSGWNPDCELDQEAPDIPTAAEENTAVRTLRRIRSLNNDIADPQMSYKIDRIEGLTARIFRLLDEHPEKEGELRSFMSYYLPETLRLLERYAQLEAQGVEGENIRNAMGQIEGMMDKVADGFETQLDKLFENDAMDISADLKVMEQMLQKDGLTVEENPF